MESGDYREYCRLFRLAETKIKRIETLFGDLAIPAVNELRYAGFHCACSLIPESEEAAQDELRSAERHCQRSIYESMEIGISALLNRISYFKKDYRFVPITKAIPDYVEYLRQIRETQDFIGTTNRRDMPDAWEDIQGHFDKLLEIERTLEASRPELNKYLLLWRIGILIALLSPIVAVLLECS